MKIYININIYIYIMDSVKKDFINVINYINDNKIVIKDNNIKDNLKILIEKWRNYKNKDMDYFYNMKENHHYINGQFKGELDKLWMTYIRNGMDQRLNMLDNSYNEQDILNIINNYRRL